VDNTELEKSKAFTTLDLIDYVPHSVFSKTILKKTTGNISLISIDKGEGLAEKTIPFDTFMQIIEGKAEFVIDGTSLSLEAGQAIIIPAHKSNIIKANVSLKIIQTVIKSGYE